MFKRQLPLLITGVIAVFMVIGYFVPHPAIQVPYGKFQNYYMIIATFTMILGILNLLQFSLLRMSRGAGRERFFNGATVFGLLSMIFVGIVWGIAQGSPFDWMFNYVYTPVSATIFSLLAFFIASASFRAFRAKSTMATILLVTAFIVMLGRIPVGEFLTGGSLINADESGSLFVRTFFHIPKLTDWIMDVVNGAGQRAILIGAALGLIATSVKIILGIERSYLGGE